MRFFLVFIVLLIGCKNTRMDTSKGIQSIDGLFNVIYISNVSDNNLEDKGLTIKFTDNSKVSGNNGCNNYGADCTVNNNIMSIGAIMSTKRFCMDKNEIEDKFMTKLQIVNRFLIKENTLTLFKNDEVLIKAEKISEKE